MKNIYKRITIFLVSRWAKQKIVHHYTKLMFLVSSRTWLCKLAGVTVKFTNVTLEHRSGANLAPGFLVTRKSRKSGL